MFTKKKSGVFTACAVFLIVLSTSFSFQRSTERYSNRQTSGNDSIDILHYTINLQINSFASKTIYGITDLQVYTLQDSVHEIHLLLQQLKIDSVWIDEERVEQISRHGNQLIIRLPEIPERESTLLVTVFYHGHPATDPHWGGFYFTPHAAFNMGVGMSVVPHSFGRAWFPCVDNFTDKATYDYFITVKDTLVAACPGTLKNIINNHNGTITYHWNLKDPISTYLSSVAISNYKILRDTIAGQKDMIPALYFVRPEDVLRAGTTFSHVPEYLKIFEKLFGPYPWEKIGYVSVPFLKGAMEHATCIAIPNYVVNGTHDFDDLLSHEFAHSWFGNFVTCQTAEDMWLNEGWATYCEALYREFSTGEQAYRNFIRNNHRKTLQFAHVADKGYFPVYGIPKTLTYGRTVYNKGTDVIHTLRYYLGDQLFFDAMKEYFKTFGFQNISTRQFESFLSMTTHRNLEEFFNTWIYAPGFPHFELDSFNVIRRKEDYITSLFLKQRLIGRSDYSYSSSLDISLLDNTFKREDKQVFFSGPSQMKIIITPFRPVAVMVNLDQKVSDATTSAYKIIRKPGKYTYENCFFNLDVISVIDSAFFRVVHHWIAPENNRKLPYGLILSKNRYWSVEGILLSSFSVQGEFYYNFSRSMRNGWLDTKPAFAAGDSLTLVYRPSPRYKWRRIPARNFGNIRSGFIRTSFIRKGQYCLAIKKSPKKGQRPPSGMSSSLSSK